jgi:hypothetical protein
MGVQPDGLLTPTGWPNAAVGQLECAIACEIERQVDGLMDDPETICRRLLPSIRAMDQVEDDWPAASPDRSMRLARRELPGPSRRTGGHRKDHGHEQKQKNADCSHW